MKKLFSPLIILSLAFSISIAFAHPQDSLKKTTPKPQAVKPAVVTPSVTPTAAQPQNTDRSLAGQYKYLTTKLYGYQQGVVGAFYHNVMDSLKTTRAALQKAQAAANSRADSISRLNNAATQKDEQLAQSQSKVDEISLLGIGMNKTAYNTLMWGLVLGFGAALLIVIFTTARFRSEAKYRIKLYNELEEEFQTYKSKAHEKEKKLARDLQTERNKLDELLGR